MMTSDAMIPLLFLLVLEVLSMENLNTGDPNLYMDFEPPSNQKDEDNLRNIQDAILNEEFDSAFRTLSLVLTRFSCSHVLQELYQPDADWFSKFIKFCTTKVLDIDQRGCLLRGLANAMVRTGDVNDTVKVNTTASALLDSVEYKTTFENVPLLQAIGTLRHMEKHAVGDARKVIEDILKPFLADFDIAEKVNSTIQDIRASKLFLQYSRVQVFSITPEMDYILSEVFNKSSVNFPYIARFVGQIMGYYELVHCVFQSLITTILIPYNVNDVYEVMGKIDTMLQSDQQHLNLPQDVQNETRQLIKKWLVHLKPKGMMLTSYISLRGLNFTTSELTEEITKDISRNDFARPEVLLFERLSDVDYFNEIGTVLDKLNISGDINKFESLMSFTFGLKSKERAFVVVWGILANEHQLNLNIQRVVKLEEVAQRWNLPSVIPTAMFPFFTDVHEKFVDYFKNIEVGNVRKERHENSLEYLAEKYPSTFQKFFWYYLTGTSPMIPIYNSVPRELLLNTSTILHGIERFSAVKGAILMYTAIVESNLQEFDVLRLVFGMKMVLSRNNATLDKVNEVTFRFRLPEAAWAILSSDGVNIIHQKLGYYLGVNHTEPPIDKYKADAGLFRLEGLSKFTRKDEAISTKWIITRPDLAENVYYIQNDQSKQYLIASVLDFSQDRRRVLMWRPERATANAKWNMELVGDNVTMSSTQWKESLHGGRMDGRGVIYTWMNTRRTYTNQVSKTPPKLKDLWLIQPVIELDFHQIHKNIETFAISRTSGTVVRAPLPDN